MQRQPLARHVDARKLAASGAEINAVEAVSQFSRFVAGLYSDAGEVSIALRLFVDEQRHAHIQGDVSATVQGTCQRCLQPVSLDIASTFECVLVWSETQIQSVPKEYEAIVLDSDELDLFALVEDELIVSTPYISYHPEGECKPSGPTEYLTPEQSTEAKADNPFAILEKLKSGD